MRSLQNFKGFHSNGRVLYPAGFTFSSTNVYIECGADPQWGNAFTFARVQGITNRIDIEIVPPLAPGEIVTFWYLRSSTPVTLDYNTSPLDQGFEEATTGAVIRNVYNGSYLYFGVDSIDPFAGIEFADYSLRVINISPALTFANLTVYNLC